MSYKIKYLGTREQKYSEARKDFINYIGEDKYNRLRAELANNWLWFITNSHELSVVKTFINNTHFAISISGISGLPVTALLHECAALANKAKLMGAENVEHV